MGDQMPMVQAEVMSPYVTKVMRDDGTVSFTLTRKEGDLVVVVMSKETLRGRVVVDDKSTMSVADHVLLQFMSSIPDKVDTIIVPDFDNYDNTTEVYHIVHHP